MFLSYKQILELCRSFKENYLTSILNCPNVTPFLAALNHSLLIQGWSHHFFSRNQNPPGTRSSKQILTASCFRNSRTSGNKSTDCKLRAQFSSRDILAYHPQHQQKYCGAQILSHIILKYMALLLGHPGTLFGSILMLDKILLI